MSLFDQNNTTETGDRQLMDQVMKGVDKFGKRAMQWIEALEDVFVGSYSPNASQQSPEHNELRNSWDSHSTSPPPPPPSQDPTSIQLFASPAQNKHKKVARSIPTSPTHEPVVVNLGNTFKTLPATSPFETKPSSASTARPIEAQIHEISLRVTSLDQAHVELAELQQKHAKLKATCKALARKCQRILRENEQLKHHDPLEDVVGAQLRMLLADKSKLIQEKEALQRENAALQELLMLYHQQHLQMQGQCGQDEWGEMYGEEEVYGEEEHFGDCTDGCPPSHQGDQVVYTVEEVAGGMDPWGTAPQQAGGGLRCKTHVVEMLCEVDGDVAGSIAVGGGQS